MFVHPTCLSAMKISRKTSARFIITILLFQVHAPKVNNHLKMAFSSRKTMAVNTHLLKHLRGRFSNKETHIQRKMLGFYLFWIKSKERG